MGTDRKLFAICGDPLASFGFFAPLLVFVPILSRFYEEMSTKQRLDLYLTSKGFASTRQQAQLLIRAGKVRDKNGQLLDKPGQQVAVNTELLVKEAPRFVSRGGEKLL